MAHPNPTRENHSAHEALYHRTTERSDGTTAVTETCACGATRETTRTPKSVTWSPWTVLMFVLLCLLGACTTTEPATPDAGTVAPASCEVQVLQTIDSTSTCAVTVTTEVTCAPGAVVTSATIIAETEPWLDTGSATETNPIACGQPLRVTFGGMPCYEQADGLVTIDDDLAHCSGSSP